MVFDQIFDHIFIGNLHITLRSIQRETHALMTLNLLCYLLKNNISDFSAMQTYIIVPYVAVLVNHAFVFHSISLKYLLSNAVTFMSFNTLMYNFCSLLNHSFHLS